MDVNLNVLMLMLEVCDSDSLKPTCPSYSNIINVQILMDTSFTKSTKVFPLKRQKGLTERHHNRQFPTYGETELARRLMTSAPLSDVTSHFQADCYLLLAPANNSSSKPHNPIWHQNKGSGPHLCHSCVN